MRGEHSENVLAPAIKCLRASPFDPNHGIVITCVQNGVRYLRHFLNHYRAIGVRRFAILDNLSTDGTKDALLAQPDCDVYSCNGDWRSSKCGTLWLNILARQYQTAPWILRVDIDELAVYEGWPTLPLDAFAENCSKSGLSAVAAIMIDMYSPTPLAHAPSLEDSIDILKTFPCYDSDGYNRIRDHDWRSTNFPRQIIDGGPAKRLFARPGPGWLAKTPLLLEPGPVYIDPHTVLPVSLNFSPVLIALLHFRFTSALIDKIDAVYRLGYSKGSVDEYHLLGNAIRTNPDFTLLYSRTETFTTPSSLIRQNLLQSLSDLRCF